MRLPARVPLGTFPTPLEPLPGLSRELGVEVLVKRDDLTGLGLGGNKVRKLEMLLQPALTAGAEWLVTCGSIQSNHCRCTAAAAARLGLRCHLVLFEGRHNAVQGNHLLDRLFGATVEVRPAAEFDRRQELMAAAAGRLGGAYVVPYGGSDAVGAAAYAWAYQETRGQLGDGRGGTLICVTSSGATHAGLAVGEAVLGGPRVAGVSIADPAPAVAGRVAELAAACADLLEVDVRPQPWVVDGQQGEGYGVPTAAGLAAIRRLAAADGLLLDPVYTGKAMAGLIEGARSGALEPPLVFLHSGGVPALFAYAGELLEDGAADRVEGKRQERPAAPE